MSDSEVDEAKRQKGREGGTEPRHAFAQAPVLVFSSLDYCNCCFAVPVVMNLDLCFASFLYPLRQHQGIRAFGHLDGIRMSL